MVERTEQEGQPSVGAYGKARIGVLNHEWSVGKQHRFFADIKV